MPADTGLVEMLERNTKLLLNCLADLPQVMSNSRAGERTNSIEFLVLHLLDVRIYMGNYLGCEIPHPYQELVQDASGIEDISSYPLLEDMARHWERTSDEIAKRMRGMPEAQRGAASTAALPMATRSVESCLIFLLQHEMYHIGQVALLRKHAGLAAMRWS